MRVDLLTREYPPYVYGGAGAHVDHLSRHLRRMVDLRVHCFGEPRGQDFVSAYQTPGPIASHNMALQAVAVNAAMAAAVTGTDVVHSHTWYANFAGHLAKTLHGVPHVVTAHTLEPRRPWKVEQLHGGYTISTLLERTALLEADHIIAVSRAMRDDLLACYPEIDAARITVAHNGVDASLYTPTGDTSELARYGVCQDRVTVVCVARITPHKGLTHLLRAARYFDGDVQLVIVADTADSPAHRRRFASQVKAAQDNGVGVVWIRNPMDRRAFVQLLSHARVFVCPSLYEPLGIVNLEAMACCTPVVATATGGIPEVVIDGRTGFLVGMQPDDDGRGEPRDPDGFAKDLALRVNALLGDDVLARRMGEEGRQRAVTHFSWESAARQVRDIYAAVER